MSVLASYKVPISGRGALNPAGRTLLRRCVRAALRAHGVHAAQIGIALLGDSEIAVLNEQRLGHKGPTDVLTFDVRDPGSHGIEGEIAVSVDIARREAKRRGHREEAELALYVVHGVLHLLGYDDKSKTASAAMHAMEDRVLEGVGLGRVYRKSPAVASEPARRRQTIAKVA